MGTDYNCPVCAGTDKEAIYRCPTAMSKEVYHLIPYFTDWRISNRVAWPNGQLRLYQPIRLSQAYDLLDEFVHEAIDNESKS